MGGLRAAMGGKGRLSAALVLVFIVALGSSQMVRSARASDISSSSFTGTTYVNEHFRMEIGPQYATLYDPYAGNVLVQRMYWIVQMIGPAQQPEMLNSLATPNWVSMNWTSAPNVMVGQMGSYHRVGVNGVLDNRLAVSIFFDGNSTGIPSEGPKISVVLQSISGGGVFRVQWHFEGVSAGAFNLENRIGSTRQVIQGPISPQVYVSHARSGENSFVAIGSDGSTVLFGANWQDALWSYQGAYVSPSKAGANVAIQFGQFPLRTGQAVIVDPVVEGGGGGGYPTVYISTPSVSEGGTIATLTWATLTWSDFPSTACDTFQWGTSTSYGNTVYTCSHSVSLSNLQTGVLYYYQISAYATGYSIGTYISYFYPARQLLSQPLFGTTYLNPNGINYPWQGNQVYPWEGHVFGTGANLNCHEYSIVLSSSCFPSNYIINPVVNNPDGSYSYSYQVKGNLDNSNQDPGQLGFSTASQGCDFPSGTVNPNGWSVYTYNNVYRPIGSSTPSSCNNSIPSWSYPRPQKLLDPNQYFTTTVSRTAWSSRTQTLAAWYIGWAIVNFAVDFYVQLDSPASFYAPDDCGNWAWRTSNFLELEVYLYMYMYYGQTNYIWGSFPVGSSPVVVALSGNPVRGSIFGCSTSAPYWIYVRTHPIQIDACYPNWCPQFTYTTMRGDVLSAESSAKISPIVDGTMMNFQIGIEAANYAMLYWVADAEWWGSGYPPSS